MLNDRAKIFVQAGSGGNGCTSFRREAGVPKGGPDGGDGGRGGDLILICDQSLRDLKYFRRQGRYKAGRGKHGEGSMRHGADGETLELRVPPGTTVKLDIGTEYDLTQHQQRAVIARGGLGGRGNKHFANPTRQAPRFAERGLPGEEHWLELRLKLLADVGLVGLPNSGKSSLLARLTRANPKVGNYPFTTTSPMLGTVERHDRQLVIADIPGLIEGASHGAGLGHEFLAHIERTKLLIHLVELEPYDGSDPLANYALVEQELSQHNPYLKQVPRIIALSKSDLVTEQIALDAQQKWQRELDIPVIAISSVTGFGLETLLQTLYQHFESISDKPVSVPEPTETTALSNYKVYTPKDKRGFKVERSGQNSFSVTGASIDRLAARFDLNNEEALSYVEQRLRSLGIIDALERAGFQAGDEVELGGIKFELD